MGSNKITIENCGFSGEINGTDTNSCGGFIGWVGSNGTVIIENSFICAEFTVNASRGNTFVRNAPDAIVTNCYYLNELNETPSTAVKKTADEFASGEVAYLLQEGNGDNLVWGQTSSIDGSTPVITTNEDYRVLPVKDGTSTVNYTILKKGETNGDGQVDIYDYQNLVNIALSDNNEKDFAEKFDLNGDGTLDVTDCVTAQRANMSESDYTDLTEQVQNFTGMCYMKNADFDIDGVVDILDCVLLERLLKGHRVAV